MKGNFYIIGIIIQASGFEDLAFQAGICTSGSIKSVLSGSQSMDSSQYFLEALERLLFKNLKETKSEMPDSIKRAAMIEPNKFNSSDCESAQTLLQMYVHFQKDIRQGKYGLTQKFWLLYMDLIQHELLTRYSVQENNYNSRLYCWKFFHKIYFALNRTNYARYGSFL